MAANIEPNDTVTDVLKKINAEIDSRRSYGVRPENIDKPQKAAACIWSNGSAAWRCGEPQDMPVCPHGSKELKEVLNERNAERFKCSDYDWDKIGRLEARASRLIKKEGVKTQNTISPTQCLDANEMVITGLTPKQANLLAPLFSPLPLYSGSTEAGWRDEFSLRGIEIPPGIAQHRLDDLDPETIKALAEKAALESTD